jgi:hypothetical protein
MHKFNVESAQYRGKYKIFLTFDDGAEGVVDLHEIIFPKKQNAFARLQDVEQFKNFSLKYQTIVWGKDLDLAPEFLHDLLLKTSK